MAIKKIKLPNNSTVDINDARDVTFLDADGILRSVTTEFRFIEDGGGSIAALPGQGDGSTEDYTLATTNEVIFKSGTGPNSVRNSRLTTSQSQASGEGGVSIMGTSTGDYAVSAGNLCVANGKSSYAEGYNTETGGDATSNTKTIGGATSSGSYAHAEGNATIAKGRNSHAEGLQTFAAGASSHAEGVTTTASGLYSHAEGYHTTSSGSSSHAEGYYTQTNNQGEHAEGKYNKSTSSTTLHSVGIGTSDSARKNAHEITTDGKHYILGVGGYDGTNVTTSGVQDLATVINSGASGNYLPLTGGTLTGNLTIQSGSRINTNSIWSSGEHGYSFDNSTGIQVFGSSMVNKVKIAGPGDLYHNVGGSDYVILDDRNSVRIFNADDSGSTTAGTWKATASGVTTLTDGLTIRYKLVVAGAATTTLNLNNLGAKTVYRFNTTKLTTHYAVGSYIILTYNSSLNSGCWITVDGYDSNSDNYVRQYVASNNNEYSLLARYATTSVSSYEANYARFADGVTVNPSTDTITAAGFKVTGGTSSQVLTANGSTRSITISSSEPTSGTGSDGDIWIVI